MCNTMYHMASAFIDDIKPVSRIHPEFAPVAPTRSRLDGADPEDGAAATGGALATGWFGAFEASFSSDVDLHPMLSRTVEDALSDHGALMYTDGSCLRGVIDLWSEQVDEDTALVEALEQLRTGVLARAAITLTVFHDSMGAVPAPSYPGATSLWVVR